MNSEEVVDDQKKKKALLDLLLTTTIDGKPLTNSDIREEIDTFIFEVESFINFFRFSIK
jgi:cytochrome P450 family 4